MSALIIRSHQSHAAVAQQTKKRCGDFAESCFGTKYKNKAEFVGGVVLVGLGIKILLEGLGIL